MNLADLSELKPVLERHGFSFSKSLGQNFLVSPKILEAIAGAAVLPGCSALEIGPGAGALTAALASRAERVAAIEKDESLRPVLQETLAPFSNAEVIYGDALKLDLRAVVSEKLGGNAVAAANLPYYITAPAIKKLLEARVFKLVTVTVQKEVADKLVSSPGSPLWGAFPLTVLYYAAPAVLFSVPAGAFYPRPGVDSAVVSLAPREPLLTPGEERAFFALVSAAFSMRRKTLANALSPLFGKDGAAELLRSCALDPGQRGEALGLEEFCHLARSASRFLQDSR